MKQGNRAAALVVMAGLATLVASTAALAQGAGTLMLRAGATQIRPNVDSGDLSAPAFVGTRVDIRPDTQLSGGLTYMLTDHVSLDLPLALPFKHEIVGDGAIAGVGKIGEVRALPFTLLGQYRFLAPTAAFRPYVGAGLTYAKFYKDRSTAVLSGLTGGTPANPTLLSVESKFAPTLQVGASYALNTRWFIDLSLTRTFLKTRTTLSTGQTLDATLNPDSIGLGLGYVF
ncbi:MAG: OmpW family outer membrane protein [Burkholderiaceae bacterium]